MQNTQQIFYITYRQDDGYLDGMIDQDKYNNLSDDDRKNYTQVIVDLAHINGWGRYWNHVRYINGTLSYPDNYPKDQSETIADLKNQLSKIINSNNDYQNTAKDLQNKLNEANSKISDNQAASQKTIDDLKGKLGQANDEITSSNQQIQRLSKLSMQLQLQVANASKTPQSNTDSNKTNTNSNDKPNAQQGGK